MALWATLLIMLLSASSCVEEEAGVEGSERGAEAAYQTQSNALSESSAVDELSDEEVEAILTPIWEVPGNEHLRPDQAVLRARRVAPGKANMADPAILAYQEAFLQAWEGRRRGLENRGASPEEIAAARRVFKRQFFYGPDQETSQSVNQ